jgi:hypothetical protein
MTVLENSILRLRAPRAAVQNSPKPPYVGRFFFVERSSRSYSAVSIHGLQMMARYASCSTYQVDG